MSDPEPSPKPHTIVTCTELTHAKYNDGNPGCTNTALYVYPDSRLGDRCDFCAVCACYYCDPQIVAKNILPHKLPEAERQLAIESYQPRCKPGNHVYRRRNAEALIAVIERQMAVSSEVAQS